MDLIDLERKTHNGESMNPPASVLKKIPFLKLTTTSVQAAASTPLVYHRTDVTPTPDESIVSVASCCSSAHSSFRRSYKCREQRFTHSLVKFRTSDYPYKALMKPFKSASLQSCCSSSGFVVQLATNNNDSSGLSFSLCALIL